MSGDRVEAVYMVLRFLDSHCQLQQQSSKNWIDDRDDSEWCCGNGVSGFVLIGNSVIRRFCKSKQETCPVWAEYD